MNEVDKAYIAGLVDADGCISIAKRARRGTHQLTVQLGMCNKPTMQWVADQIDANLRKPQITRTGREYWYLELSGNRCQALLRQLLPYLRVKRPNAELALAFPMSEPGVNVSDQDWDIRDNLRDAMSDLNS